MKRPNVCITGLGAVSAAGANVATTLASLHAGQRNISATLPWDSALNCPTFQVNAALPELAGPEGASRSLCLSMRAVHEAMASAAIERFVPGTRIGVCIGTTVASQLNSLPFYEAYRKTKFPPLESVYDYLHANLSQAIGRMLRVAGPRLTIVNACSSGTDAIGIAAGWIRAGLCDAAIAGGADELSRVAIAGFWSLGVTSSEPCRPFDRDRSGLNLGEGAGMLVLESGAHAAARGHRPTFELAGYGGACDAHHLTAPHPEGRGLAAAIQRAMQQADVKPEQIAFINAHGTATLDNDRVEGQLIARMFGTGVKMLSTKGYTGHTLGAAGGLEAVFSVLGLREGWIPGSAGFENSAPEIGITPVSRRIAVSGEYALSTSLAFGGNNAALLVRRVA